METVLFTGWWVLRLASGTFIDTPAVELAALTVLMGTPAAIQFLWNTHIRSSFNLKASSWRVRGDKGGMPFRRAKPGSLVPKDARDLGLGNSAHLPSNCILPPDRCLCVFFFYLDFSEVTKLCPTVHSPCTKHTSFPGLTLREPSCLNAHSTAYSPFRASSVTPVDLLSFLSWGGESSSCLWSKTVLYRCCNCFKVHTHVLGVCCSFPKHHSPFPKILV